MQSQSMQPGTYLQVAQLDASNHAVYADYPDCVLVHYASIRYLPALLTLALIVIVDNILDPHSKIEANIMTILFNFFRILFPP